ncbi:MAG TPA: hypothetical protein VF590_09610 [Isosphaeraceae bacterium]|jgi:hypothetical protein
MTIKRAWRVDRELFQNQGDQVVVLSRGGLAPEDVRGVEGAYRRGDFGVAIGEVTGDVEDVDRNVVTESGNTYRVITNGQDIYLIEL